MYKLRNLCKKCIEVSAKLFFYEKKNGHFLNANANFSNLTIVKDWFLNITALAYYLNLDAKDGFYTAEYITLEKKNFPLALQTILNHKLNSNIKSESLLWNVSLIYSF